MDRALRHRCLAVEPTVVRGGGLGHSPTSRHHCFSVTATLDTFTPVLFSAVPNEHFSPARGILGHGDDEADLLLLLLLSQMPGGYMSRHQSSESFEGAVLVTWRRRTRGKRNYALNWSRVLNHLKAISDRTNNFHNETKKLQREDQLEGWRLPAAVERPYKAQITEGSRI